ncbi:MAG: hypothetical protein AAB582_02030 [Patescibacteria group bacterium]
MTPTMNIEDFAAFGLTDSSYLRFTKGIELIRQLQMSGGDPSQLQPSRVYCTVHRADGLRLGIFDTKEDALTACFEHELGRPSLVH